MKQRQFIIGLSAIYSWVFMALFLCCGQAPNATAEEPAQVTEAGFISGTMNIDFGTRKSLDPSGELAEGSPAKGAVDVFTLSLNVAKTTEFAGKITRQPRLYSKIIGREVQPAQLTYDIGLNVRNPSNLQEKKAAGKWVGNVSIDKDGVYDFGTGEPGASQLRMAVDAVGKSQAFVGIFGGRIFGKSEQKRGALVDQISATIREYKRIVNGKTVKVVAKKTDPLTFSNLVLGEGPVLSYPKTTVNGNLDYDYETGNWYTNGIRFKYNSNGVEREDVVTGSIKWVEDPNRTTNGKGSYEFNLRFNEDKNKAATDESAAFSGNTEQTEDAFFAVDNTIPSLTGTISYEDTMGRGRGSDAEPKVMSSKISYRLDVNKLTKQQAMNMFKLWTLIVGPVNDE